MRKIFRVSECSSYRGSTVSHIVIFERAAGRGAEGTNYPKFSAYTSFCHKEPESEPSSLSFIV